MAMRLIFCAILFVFSIANKASAYSIKGQVLDSSQSKPLDSVWVSITFSNSKLVSGAYADSNGMFMLALLPANNFEISVSKDGYAKWVKSFPAATADIDLGIILLRDMAKQITGALITVENPVKQKGDTTEFSAEAFKVNPDATAEDLVKKMPGITIENGKVKAHGEEVKKVTLDGKDFFGDDAQTALRNLPAEVVSKIQVFDRMSDQAQFTGFDDGQSAKSMNIKTKLGKANGTFGKTYAGYGNDSRYQSGLTYNKFKAARRITLLGMSNNLNQQNFTSQDMLGLSSGGGNGGMNSRGPGGYFSTPTSSNFLVDQAGGISTTHSAGINYNDKWGEKWNIGASYFFNNSINLNQQNILRTYSNTQPSEITRYYSQQSNIKNNQFNHRFNLRLEYMFDSFNSIIYTPTFTVQNSNITQDQFAKTYNNAVSLNNSELHNLITGEGLNFNNNLLYRHKFKFDRRTFTFNFQNQLNLSNSSQNNLSSNTTFLPFDTTYFTKQAIDNQTPTSNYNFRGTYTEPLNLKSMLQIDYRYNMDVNATDKRTNNYNESEKIYNVFDTALSNKYNTNYSYHQPGISWRYSDKGSSISIGAAYQYSQLKGDQIFPVNLPINKNFQNILPRIFLNLKLGPSQNLRGNFRGSTRIPSISQLQNVVNISNPILLTSGNPDLKQETSNNITLRYNSSNVQKSTSFFLGLFTTQTNHYITNSTRLIQSDTQISEGFTALRGSQISSPVNLNGFWNNRLFGYYGFPFKKIKSNLNVNGSYSLNRIPGLVNGVKNISATHNVSGGLVVTSNISENVDFSLSYTGNYYQAVNSTQTALNNSYVNHLASAKGNYIIKKKLVLSSDLTYTKYTGLNNGFNQQFYLWNAGIAYKFMKNNAAEFKLSCFDILKQNRSINRSITETYIEDNFTNVLTRYFMGTFTYTFRKFANGGNMPKPEENPHGMPGGGTFPGNPPGSMPGGRPPM